MKRGFAASQHPLRPGDKAALTAPARERGPGEIGEAPCRLVAPSGVALGLGEVGTDMLDQTCIPCEAEDIVDPVGLALGHQFLAVEARVCAEHDLDCGPALADSPDDARHPARRAGAGVEIED